MIKTLAIVTALCNIAFMIFNTVVGPLARLVGMPDWHIGVMVSAAGLCWMLSSRAWGAAGDRNGHWEMMRKGLIAFVVGFVALCVAAIAGLERVYGPLLLFILLFILRCFLGAVFAVVPVASQALIAQNFAPDKRAGSFAALGAAGAAGMVLGPAIGGALGALSLWYPLLMATVFAMAALLVVLKSELNTKARVGASAPDSLSKLGLTDQRIRWPMFVAFSAMFSVMSAQINTAFYIIDRLHISAEQATGYTGLALTFVGVAIMLSQILVKVLSTRGINLTPNHMIAMGTGIATCGFFGATLVTTMPQICFCYFVCGFGMGFVFPAFGALASLSVATHEVGAAAGTVGAAQAFGMVAGPLVAPLVFAIEPRLPYYMIALMLFVTAIIAMTKLRRAALA